MIVSDRDVGVQGLIRIPGFDGVYDLIVQVGEPSLLVFDGVYSRIPEFLRFASSRGLNVFLFDFIDPSFEVKLAGGFVSLDVIVRARLARLEFSNALNAPPRFNLGKVVSRRDILTRGPVVALEYRVTPILDSDRCGVLDKCTLCVDGCPYKALSGKPPTVDLDKCVMCGLCLSICPIEALSTPRFTVDSIEWYIRAIRSSTSNPMYVIITTYSLLKDMYDISGVNSPALVLPFERVEEVPVVALLRLASRGLTPVVYSSRVDEHYRSLVEDLRGIGVIHISDSVDDLRKILSVNPMLRDRGYSGTYRGYVRLALEEYVEDLTFKFPGYGELIVDENLCTLCEACVKLCPTGALVTERDGDIIRLLVDYDECIACSKCMIGCPEKAIEGVNWRFKRRPQTKIKLAESRIARCIRCGAPLEPEKLVLKVERVLREAGLHQALETTRLCAKCKAERMLGLWTS